MVILEILLTLGLLALFFVVLFIHFISTTTLDWVIEITRVEPEPYLHPWFLTAEAILFLSAFYIFINLIS